MRYTRIRDLREDSDLTQIQLAEQLGLYTTTYQRYERGERELPLDIAIALAKFYNVSIDYIAGLADTPKTLDGQPYAVKKKYNITQNGNITNHFK